MKISYHFYGIPAKKERTYIEKVTNYTMKQLFGGNDDKIRIDFADKTEYGLPPEAGGMCTQHPNTKNRYLIVLDRSPETMEKYGLHVIIHELAHVRQMYTNSLITQDKEPFGIYFRKRFYPAVNLMHTLDWAKRPWELDAEGVTNFIIKHHLKLDIKAGSQETLYPTKGKQHIMDYILGRKDM